MENELREFHNGDRVEIVNIEIVDPKPKLHNGSTGTVVCDDGPDSICIEYDDNIDGHDGGGYGEQGYCWWTPPKALELICNEQITISPRTTEDLYAFLGI